MTHANVADADGTVVFAVDARSSGTRLTITAAEQVGKPCLVVRVDLSVPPSPESTAEFHQSLNDPGVTILNMAGNRESGALGLCEWVRRFLGHAWGSSSI